MAQLEECLQSCGDYALLHVIKQLMILYLEKKDWASIEKLFQWEEKVISIPYNTPYKKSELAHYYKLKGDYCVSVGNIENGLNVIWKAPRGIPKSMTNSMNGAAIS
ncbi:hypothetical protein [Paenibacillus thiaminolyticus]|uniref:Uncharacterized protein n=1 Tax=Paenibacillus thiaminolyticus TaxID=49283 RepID=A0A3A3GEY4_PANTH|nr:hypothetical protein [Paenibacillus thiaminolyticus]RJG22596.1 hypothetical protein DQX05_16735 [Paenibacillus thiaminolyticus]